MRRELFERPARQQHHQQQIIQSRRRENNNNYKASVYWCVVLRTTAREGRERHVVEKIIMVLGRLVVGCRLARLLLLLLILPLFAARAWFGLTEPSSSEEDRDDDSFSVSLQFPLVIVLVLSARLLGTFRVWLGEEYVVAPSYIIIL